MCFSELSSAPGCEMVLTGVVTEAKIPATPCSPLSWCHHAGMVWRPVPRA